MFELVDAGNALSLSLGLAMGYALGRLKNRTELAIQEAEQAQEAIKSLRAELDEHNA